MANKKSLKSAIIASVIAMVLSVTTLFGTTFAWFTDSVTNTNNIIKSGNLDVELWHSNTCGYDETIDEEVKGDTKLFLNNDGEQILWEPGVKTDETFRIQNMGTLALKYELRVKSAFETVVDGKKLSDVLSIEAKYLEKDGNGFVTPDGKLNANVAFDNGYVIEGTLLAGESVDYYVAISWKPSAIDNDYNVAGGLSMVLAIDLVATQTTVEKDGFNGSDYDLGATYTESKYAFPSEDFVLPENATESETLTTISESPVSVEVPASLLNKLKESGVTEMKVATTKPQIDVNNKTVSFESVELFDQNGKVIDLDALNLGEEVEVTLPVGGAFNEGEPVDVYHDGVKTATGYVNANGDVVYEVEHFCEIKVKDAEEMVSINGRYEIGNYNQLVDFQNRVNAGEPFSRKTVALVNDIDLAGAEWTPIGNSSKSFQGIFDGQNHTISNLNCVKNGVSNVGLFGFTTNGEIKNLTVENAKVAGRLNVGVVAGTPYTSKFTNVTVKGHVEVDGMAYVGGVGGKNAYANWENITVDVDETSYVNANSVENGVAYRTYVGGVIGFMGEGGHVFSNITSNIDVIGSTIDVGGITGIAHYGNKFENVKCSGDVKITNAQEADEAEEIGGIAGVWHNENGTTVTLANCEFTGALSTNIEVDLKNNTFTGKPYITNGTGKLFVNGLVVVYTADQLVEALENNNGVLFANDIEINPANMSNAYGKTGINVKNGQTIDGNGYTLDIKGAGGTWDSGINTTGGIIRNIKVTGSFRGIFINHNSTHSETVVLENVIIDGTTYTISCDQGLYQGLVATNCTFNGWTSFAKTLGNAKFIDCNFGEGNGYAYCRPYATTEFSGCTFEAGYTVDESQAKVSFENCTFAE